MANILKNIVLFFLIAVIFIPFLFIQKTFYQNNFAKNSKEIKSVNFSFNSLTQLAAGNTILEGEKNGTINILALGIAGEGFESPNLTDTVLITSLNLKKNKLNFISIPRDLYVKIPNSQNYGKINSLYRMEKENNQNTDLTKKKIYEITGIKIDYSVIINVNSLKNLIDALEGINVWVEKDIYDPKFPTSGYGQEIFQMSAGWRFFDGETAVKYVRTRNDTESDFGRIKRQQQVLLAVKKKIENLNIIWDSPKIINLMNAASQGFKSDLSLAEIKKLYDLSKNINAENISGLVIEANNLLKEKYIKTSGGKMFILEPKIGLENYEDIKSYVKLKLENN